MRHWYMHWFWSITQVFGVRLNVHEDRKWEKRRIFWISLIAFICFWNKLTYIFTEINRYLCRLSTHATYIVHIISIDGHLSESIAIEIKGPIQKRVRSTKQLKMCQKVKWIPNTTQLTVCYLFIEFNNIFGLSVWWQWLSLQMIFLLEKLCHWRFQYIEFDSI